MSYLLDGNKIMRMFRHPGYQVTFDFLVLDGSVITINGLCGNLLHWRDATQLELLVNS